jgi:hypothetical protein
MTHVAREDGIVAEDCFIIQCNLTLDYVSKKTREGRHIPTNHPDWLDVRFACQTPEVAFDVEVKVDFNPVGAEVCDEGGVRQVRVGSTESLTRDAREMFVEEVAQRVARLGLPVPSPTDIRW